MGEGGCLGMRYVTEQISVETIISLKNGKNRPHGKNDEEGGGEINANENISSPISSAKVITKGAIQKLRNS